MNSTLDNTLGIDCYKHHEFGLTSNVAADSPRRLSSDFFSCVIGASPPPSKRRRGNEEHDSPDRMALRSTSTPRRSGRLLKTKLEIEQISCVKTAAVSRAKVVKAVIKPIVKPTSPHPVKTRTCRNRLTEPRSNKAIELRKQAMEKAKRDANRNKGPGSRAPKMTQAMKPNFNNTNYRQKTGTVPKTPEMIRRLKQSRMKPVHHKSIKEKEDDEVKMMKEHKFKAKPVPKAVKKAPVKVPIPHKAPTVPKLPNITQTKKRKIEEVDSHVEFKANPAPAYRKVPVVRRSEMMKTAVEPFSFDSKYADPNANRQKLAADEMAKLQKAREFKAMPMPDLSNAENVAPRRQRARSTLPVFELPGAALSKQKQAAFQSKVEEEVSKRRSEAQFKSREPSVLRKKPFKPVL